MEQPPPSWEPELLAHYRHLHRIPEIGLEQHQTTAYIRAHLEQVPGLELLHSEVETDLKTGLIAVLRASKAVRPPYLFRCDIDALNFKQESGVEYSSNNGLHHACGHDAHTAIMMQAVKLIADRREELTRDVYFCFQPGEEGKEGARKLLLQHPSLLSKLEHCFALHVANHRPAGALIIPEDYVTANSNRFVIEIHGKSAHVMIPHTAIDANYIGCQVVNEIYSLKNRMVDPGAGMALAVTTIEGGNGNPTSISDRIKIQGSIRSFSIPDHERVLEHMEKFTRALCDLHGATYNFNVYNRCYKAVKNQPKPIQIVRSAAQTIFHKVESSKPSYAGEDFCEFSLRVPSCYVVLAVGLPDSFNPTNLESLYPIHSNKFKLDESALYRGVFLWVGIAFSEVE